MTDTVKVLLDKINRLAVPSMNQMNTWTQRERDTYGAGFAACKREAIFLVGQLIATEREAIQPADEYEVFFDGAWKPATEQAYYSMSEKNRRIAAPVCTPVQAAPVGLTLDEQLALTSAAEALDISADRHGKKDRPVLEQIHRKHASRLRAIVEAHSKED